MSNESKLRDLAESVSGHHYESAAAKRVLDAADWADYWPVVDADGLVTGEIVGDEVGYANVDDVAMVHLADLSPKRRYEARHNGYISLADPCPDVYWFLLSTGDEIVVPVSFHGGEAFDWLCGDTSLSELEMEAENEAGNIIRCTTPRADEYAAAVKRLYDAQAAIIDERDDRDAPFDLDGSRAEEFDNRLRATWEQFCDMTI